jgi:hypothetical protein
MGAKKNSFQTTSKYTMKHIGVKFAGHVELEIELYQTSVTDQYYQLVQQNYQQHPPTFYDSARYNVEYLQQLVPQARELLGWDWIVDDFDIATTTRLHKDIELLIGQGFENIPAEWDSLINEMHFCLHAIETKRRTGALRDATMTVEWLNDSSIAMPDDFVFQPGVCYGDIKLQNPYVGHPPSMIFAQQDITNIFQTCRFHDRVKPGIVFCIAKTQAPKSFSSSWLNMYERWWRNKAPEFVEHHGWDHILRYTGWPVIGKVTNLAVLDQVCESSELSLESVNFY